MFTKQFNVQVSNVAGQVEMPAVSSASMASLSCGSMCTVGC